MRNAALHESSGDIAPLGAILRDMDHDGLARDLIRALRGHRSQRAFSRWLGYSTNVIYTWESGRRAPTAAETFRVAARAKVDVPAALARFMNFPGEAPDLTTPEGIATLLRALAGDTPVSELGRRTGLGRFRVARWLAGQNEPRLPDFLRLVEAASLRLLDFLSVFADPEALPGATIAWRAQVARRSLAQEAPWSAGVLRALELGDYSGLPAHRPGWIATRLGISAEEEARCLELLEQAGQIEWTGKHYRPEVSVLDTRLDPAAGRTMRRHWLSVADARLARGAPGQFSYNIFACSRADLERLREMHLAYFRALRQVVASSSPTEVVAVANVQLFELSTPDPFDPT